MFNRLVRQQQATQVAANLGPNPVANLKTALAHLPEATPAQVTDNIGAWYQLLEQSTPDQSAAELVAMNAELRTQGNLQGEGPQMILVNTGDNLDILTCLMEVPAGGIPNLPANSPVNQHQHIAVLGERTDSNDDWIIMPADVTKIFTKAKAKLADWEKITAPSATISNTGWPATRKGQQQEFHPIFPLYGKEMCTRVHQGLYPDDPTVPKWTPARAAFELKATVENLTKPDVQEQAKRSLLGIATRKTRTNKAGTIPFAPNGTINNQAVADALDAWTIPLIEATLDPKSPAMALANATPGAPQASPPATPTTANPGPPHAYPPLPPQTPEPHKPLQPRPPPPPPGP